MLQKSQRGKMFCVWGDLCILCASCINKIIITCIHLFVCLFVFVLYCSFVVFCFYFLYYSVLGERY